MHDPETLVWNWRRLMQIWHNEDTDKHFVVFPPIKTLKFRLCTRCAHCGKRFGWREQPYGYISSDQSWHEPCMQLRRVQFKCNDLLRYIEGTADGNAKWRVEKMHLGKLESEA